MGFGSKGFQSRIGLGSSGFGGSRPSEPESGGIALVQQKVGTTADGSDQLLVIFDNITGAGNTVVACLSFLDTATIAQPVRDVNDNALTEAITSTITGVKTYIYYLHNFDPGGEAVRFTLDLPVRASMWIGEFSGCADAAPQDTSTGTATSTALGVVPATQDPTTNSNLVIGIGGYVSATDTYSAGPSNGFTRGTATGGASVFQEVAYLIRTNSHAAVTSDVTITSAAWAGCSASFGGA